MARQPLIPALLALVLGACAQDEEFSGSLDTPLALTAHLPSSSGPFTDPVGFAADSRGGLIRPLALVEGRYLTDTPEASFLRGAPLATGSARLIAGLAAHATSADTLDVWAIDRRFGQLLKLPYITGREGIALTRQATTWGEISFLDADGSGDDPTARLLGVDVSRAAAETWTATWDGALWWVTGTRSGAMAEPARPWVDWQDPSGAIRLYLGSEATAGDSVSVTVDNGTVEIDLAATPDALSVAPDQSRMLVASTSAAGASTLRWVDTASATLGDTVALPDDARPGRMAWSTDSTSVFVADLSRSSVWEILPGDTDTVVEHVLPWPVSDVAPLIDDEGRWLYVAPAAGRSVWMLDLDTDTLRDINASTPEVDGMTFEAPVLGLEALHEAYEWPEANGDGEFLHGRTVAVALHSGRVVFMEEQTGCLVHDNQGPRTDLLGAASLLGDYQTSYDLDPFSPVTPWLQATDDASRHITVNSCGGIADAEIWSLLYDSANQSWVPSGVKSGEQARRASEDERYVSDDGAISFVIRAGGIPTEEGWSITFEVLEGVLSADGDNDGDRVRDIEMDMPGDPIFFWDVDEEGETIAWIAVAASSADVVARIDATTGLVDMLWD